MPAVVINPSGIPLLSGGFSITLPTLLTVDTSLGFIGAQQWGVFSGGAPIIVFDTFVSIDYRQGWSISDYPIERGGFESYNKVQLPFDVRVKFASGGSEENRAALLASVAAIAGDLNKYSVVTPEAIYTSVNVQHYDYHRTSTNGQGLITVEMWLLEIRETVSEASSTSAGTSGGSGSGSPTLSPGEFGAGGFDEAGFPQDPSGYSPTNVGNVNPTDTGLNITDIFNTPGAF